jgi:hypothetical protein
VGFETLFSFSSVLRTLTGWIAENFQITLRPFDRMVADGVCKQISNAVLHTMCLVDDHEGVFVKDWFGEMAACGIEEMVIVADHNLRVVHEDHHHPVGTGSNFDRLWEKFLGGNDVIVTRRERNW